MREQTKLLFVINNIQFLFSHRKEIVTESISNGYQVHIAAPPKDCEESRFFEEMGAHLHPLPMSRSKANILAEAQTLIRLFLCILKVRPALIHSITMKPNFYTGLVNRILRHRLVVAVSGLGTVFIDKGLASMIRRLIMLVMLRLAFRQKKCHVILQNDDDRRLLVERRIVDDSQVEMIRGSGVQTELFVPRSQTTGRPVVAFAARLLRQKGIEEFFQAVSYLTGVHARFVVIGDVDLGNPSSLREDEVRHRCQELGIEWWGFRSDMHNALNEVDIVCLPSYREGLPKVLIEASACGRPSVATDVPGCRDVVVHGETGLTVPARDSVELSRAIKALISDRELRERYGRAARQRAVSLYRLESVIESTLSLYSKMLNQ